MACLCTLCLLAASASSFLAAASTINDQTVLADSYAYIGEICSQESTSKWCQPVTKHFNEKVKEEPVRIALVGLTGVGKSTLTNTLCGYKADAKASAPTCVNAECTGAKHDFSDEGYKSPDAPSLRFIDAPGCNTAKYPTKSYVRDLGLDEYDAYMLVLTATRVAVSECEEMLFKHMKSTGKPMYLVLNRINEVVDNPDSEEEFSEEKIEYMIAQSKRFFVEGKLKPDLQNTFCVDARFKYRGRYDLPALQQRLIADVSYLFRMKLGGVIASHVESRDQQSKVACHIGAAVAGTISGLALIPGSSHVINELIQITLTFVLANRYEIGLSMGSALRVYLANLADNFVRVAAVTAAREGAAFFNVIPLFGQALKGSIAAGATEAMCWKTRRMMREDPSAIIEMAGRKPSGSNYIDYEAWIPTMECMAKEIEKSILSGQAYSKTATNMKDCATGKRHDEL